MNANKWWLAGLIRGFLFREAGRCDDEELRAGALVAAALLDSTARDLLDRTARDARPYEQRRIAFLQEAAHAYAASEDLLNGKADS